MGDRRNPRVGRLAVLAAGILVSAVAAVGPAPAVVRAAGISTITDTQRISAIPQPSGTGTRPGFGQSLAVSADGSTMIVGAPLQQANGTVGVGAAYIYHRDSTGTFQLARALAAPRPFVDGEFGTAVALSADGSVALVGQIHYAGLTLPDPWPSGEYYQGGIGWIFRASTEWSPELLGPTVDAGYLGCDECGHSVALSRDGLHAAVSSLYEKAGKTGVDFYDYDASNSKWGDAQRLAIADSGYKMNLPSLALATDGTTEYLFAGAGRRWSVATNAMVEDVVRVLTRAAGSQSWSSPMQTLVQPGSFPDTRFGKVLSSSADGHTLLVGAEVAPSPGPTGTTGAAYVYRYDGSVFALRSTLYASDSALITHFGVGVGLNGTGTTAFVARHNNHAAYSFVEPAGGWPAGSLSESGRLDYSDTTSNDLNGAPIGVSDDLAGSRSPVIATGNAVSPQNNWQGGSVYVYQPIGTVDDGYTATGDVPLTVGAPGVLGNDYTAVAGEALSSHPLSAPSHGSLTLNGEGSFTYTPHTGYVGTDTFTYFAASAAFGRANGATVTINVTPPPITSLLPGRVLDTRPGEPTVDGQFQGIGRRTAGSTIELTVAGRAGVPASASAVMLNVTAVAPDAPGFLTVYPCGENRPTTSNVNYLAGQVVPNAVLAKIGTGGNVCIYTLAATDIVTDVDAYA